jgi:hypothetical protein
MIRTPSTTADRILTTLKTVQTFHRLLQISLQKMKKAVKE